MTPLVYMQADHACTTVSVAAKLLLEGDAMRRRYAQVIMAAGVASEVLVWVLVSVLASVHSSSPVLAALRSAIYAVAFFVVMMTLVRRLTTVLVVVEGDDRASAPLERILVAINGLEHSLAAGDVAAYLARAAYAELVLFNVRALTRESSVWQDPERRGLLEAAGYRTLREAMFRIAPLGVHMSTRVELGEDPGVTIVRELWRRPYQLVVLGAVARGAGGRLDLGSCIPTVLTQSRTPAVLLVSRDA
jgi:hypothetical protein